jgi:excinuclease ABC subunit A
MFGGRIVAQGTPEQVSLVRESHTGRVLARLLERRLLRVAEESPAYSN